jgi:hypothetical protein
MPDRARKLINSPRPCHRGHRHNRPVTMLTPVHSILAVSATSLDRSIRARESLAPLTGASRPRWGPRATARDTFLRGLAHGSSGLAVHKVRRRGPEQQSRLEMAHAIREQQRGCCDALTSTGPTVMISTTRPETSSNNARHRPVNAVNRLISGMSGGPTHPHSPCPCGWEAYSCWCEAAGGGGGGGGGQGPFEVMDLRVELRSLINPLPGVTRIYKCAQGGNSGERAGGRDLAGRP